MKLPKWKWWQWALAFLAFCIAGGVYSTITGTGALDEAAEEQVHSPAFTRFSQSRLIAPDVFAVVFPEGTDRDQVEAVARQTCGERQFCKVLGWTDAGAVARALPMTDRELAAQKFIITINRPTGMDEVIWR